LTTIAGVEELDEGAKMRAAFKGGLEAWGERGLGLGRAVAFDRPRGACVRDILRIGNWM